MQLIPEKVDGKNSEVFFQAAGFKKRYKVCNESKLREEQYIKDGIEPEVAKRAAVGRGWSAVEWDAITDEYNDEEQYEAPTWSDLERILDPKSMS